MSFLLEFCFKKRRSQFVAPHSMDPMLNFVRFGIDAIPKSKLKPHTFMIADFGSSCGRTSINLMKSIINYLQRHRTHSFNFLVIHNDLPNNDWTEFVQNLNEDRTYPALICPRSFYEQCFAFDSLSFGISSAALHYLSTVPCCIANHCYINFATEVERDRFRHQSNLDWQCFIEQRSKELKKNGILVLSIPSQNPNGQFGFEIFFDVIYQCARSSSLFTDQELLDFNIPFYLRSFHQCFSEDLFSRCSFGVLRAEFMCLQSILFDDYHRGLIDATQLANSVTLLLRPGTDPALERSLLLNGRSLDEVKRISQTLWNTVERQITAQPPDHSIQISATYIVLKKL